MTTTLLPPRPDERPGLSRRERRWIPSIAVLAVLLVVVGGGYIAAGALSEPVGAPTRVSGVVQIQPLSGWSFAGRGTLHPTGPEFARLTRGGGSVDVIAYPGVGGSAESLAVTYTRELETELTRLSVSTNLEPIRISSGLTGVRFSYSGVLAETSTPIDGQVTVVIGAGGNGAAFDGWAPAGLLAYASGDITTMVDAAVIV